MTVERWDVGKAPTATFLDDPANRNGVILDPPDQARIQYVKHDNVATFCSSFAPIRLKCATLNTTAGVRSSVQDPMSCRHAESELDSVDSYLIDSPSQRYARSRIFPTGELLTSLRHCR